MVGSKYIPDAGDIVWLDFSPIKGKEQAKKRPALIVSSKSYNAKTDLALACPITSVTKGYPFEVSVTAQKVKGVVLSDHVRSIDWNVRSIKLISRSPIVLQEVRKKLLLLVEGS